MFVIDEKKKYGSRTIEAQDYFSFSSNNKTKATDIRDMEFVLKGTVVIVDKNCQFVIIFFARRKFQATNLVQEQQLTVGP